VPKQRRLSPVPSPLRQARRHRNWTLAQLISEIDACSPEPTGVTESLASAWETGRIRTSPRYRAILCGIYQQPPEVLFAHQDEPTPELELVRAQEHRVPHELRLVTSPEELLAEMNQVVQGAEDYLVVTGSRSRDPAYLAGIEQALQERPRLVHYRLLFGLPHHQVLKEHLLRLLAIRDPDSRTEGKKTLYIGVVDDLHREPERFFCGSEVRAVATLPSLTTAGNFDCGVVLLDPHDAVGLVQHAKQLYPATRKLETAEAVQALPVLR
jgi:transcriptional regulator with XRE-family HTH domain